MHHAIATTAVDQSGGVAHQVLYRDLTIGRHGFGGWFAGLARGDAHVCEFREVFAQRIINQDLALLIKHQGAYGRHRFCHRRDIENGVRRHRESTRLVAPAVGIQRHQLAAPGDCDHRARYAAGLDIGFEHRADPGQPFAGEPDLFRLAARQGVIGQSGAGSEHANRGREYLSHGHLSPSGSSAPMRED